MKLADYVAIFCRNLGLKHAFVVSGGASLHLIHGIEKLEEIKHICCQHEQSAAMAADAYSRITGLTGLAIASSGPGATNLITGICGSYYDSIASIFITGQVSTFRMSENQEVRQLGFQETPIVDMVKNITKYSVQIRDPKRIKYELQKAYYYSRHGRPGPVLIDIPDNIQRSEINVDDLVSFMEEKQNEPNKVIELKVNLDILYEELKNASRPMIIAGWGIHLANQESEFLRLVEKLNIPVALTWAVSDILPFEHPLRVGTFGTHGSRYANFSVQNADCILSIGSRLDTKATGSPARSFARDAWKAMNDISEQEIEKFNNNGVQIDLKLPCDCKDIIKGLLTYPKLSKKEEWTNKINHWKNKYKIIKERRITGDFVDPYLFCKNMSRKIGDDSQIWCDTGSVLAWMMQAFEARRNQRIWHDFNNTAMGWALPAVIASKLAKPEMPAYCLVGDGSIMMNLQELQTAITYKLNIKIICFDNEGYSMIQQTQDQWLKSKYIASSEDGGLKMPNLVLVAESFNYETRTAFTNEESEAGIEWLSNQTKPSLLLLKIDSRCRVSPQVKYGRPNEDPDPLLDRKEFDEEMIIDKFSQ